MDFLMFDYPFFMIALSIVVAYWILIQIVLYFQQRSGKIGVIGPDTFSTRLGIGGGIIALAVSVYFIVAAGDDALKLVLSVTSLLAAVVGIVGSALVKRRRKTAGILMLAAAAGTFITVAGAFLLLLGGICSLVHMKHPITVKWQAALFQVPILLMIIWQTLTHYLDLPFFFFSAVTLSLLLGLFVMIIFSIKKMIVIKEDKGK